MQLAIEEVLTSDISNRIDIWVGYSWGMSTGFMDEWFTGMVVAPKWYARAAKELRVREAVPNRYSTRPLEADVWQEDELCDTDEPLQVMLDNGAFPAFRDGIDLSMGEQLDSLHAGLELFPDAAWVVAPDIVAEPHRSWARTVASLTELEVYGLHRVLIPFQNGQDVERVAGLAKEIGSGVFVGGTVDWKLDAVKELENLDVYVHVGRVTKDAQMAWCARFGVNSIDSSSFLRRQWSNMSRRVDFLRAFERYARKRGGALDDQRCRHDYRSPTSLRFGYQN